MKAYKKGPTIKNIMLQQRGQMRVTRNAFSESAYQLIFKYVFDLLLMDCCMKLVLLSVIMCAMKKKVSELIENIIERKYGSDGNYGCNGNNGSHGKNEVDKATEAKASKYIIIFITDSVLSQTTFLPISSTIT